MYKTFIKYLIVASLLTFIFSKTWGQQLQQEEFARLTDSLATKSFKEFRELLSIPNDAHFPDHIKRNLEWVNNALQTRNFKTDLLETGGPPLLLAKKSINPAAGSILFYMHMDGQAVDTSKWDQASPYIPVLKAKNSQGKWEAIDWEKLYSHPDKEWRIFARSASDDKGPFMMLLTALDALKETGVSPAYNLKLILDFEEEIGSPHLPSAVEKHDDQLKADILLILDGPMHNTNKPTLTFGARGIATFSITVFGPKSPQHSGHYGNYIPNPAFRLASLLASMKNEEGKVVIPGFYEGINIDQKTSSILAAVPDDEEQIKHKMGIAEADQVGQNLQEAIQYPSLNIRGMNSGWTGDKARTIVPATATADLDIRLVPESNPERLIGLVKEHIRSQGYYLVKEQPSEQERIKHPKIASFNYKISYGAFRTDIDSGAANFLIKAMTRAHGEQPVKIRTSGGSVPISPFVNTLKIPAVIVPTVNSDNNQHSPNENIRIGNYIDGVKTFIALLTQPLQ